MNPITHITHDDLGGDWQSWPYDLEQVAPNFSPWEFRCGSADEFLLSTLLLVGLQELRGKCCHAAGFDVPLYVNRPDLFPVNRGYRTEAANRRVGGSPGSQHKRGRAADVDCPALSSSRVAELAASVEVFRSGGIGEYPGFVHVDVRPNGPARWEA